MSRDTDIDIAKQGRNGPTASNLSSWKKLCRDGGKLYSTNDRCNSLEKKLAGKRMREGTNDIMHMGETSTKKRMVILHNDEIISVILVSPGHQDQ